MGEGAFAEELAGVDSGGRGREVVEDEVGVRHVVAAQGEHRGVVVPPGNGSAFAVRPQHFVSAQRVCGAHGSSAEEERVHDDDPIHGRRGRKQQRKAGSEENGFHFRKS